MANIDFGKYVKVQGCKWPTSDSEQWKEQIKLWEVEDSMPPS